MVSFSLPSSFPSHEYNLTHPHPNGRWIMFGALVLVLLSLPALVLINMATLGCELVPALHPEFRSNDTVLDGWWNTGRLPALLRPKAPPCQPKDLGRGDVFRLSNSLFDYTVMSSWNASEDTQQPEPQDQKRFEYRGQSFVDCYVSTTRFDWNRAEQAQTMTVGITCPGTNPEYPIYISMETAMTFSWLLTKDFIGQYYGPGLDSMNINKTDSSDYRKVVFAALELISQDSLTVMRGDHLSNQALSMSIAQYIDPETRKATAMSQAFTYVNGTVTEFPAEARIYIASTFNLAAVVVDAVNLDLGSRRPLQNIFKDPTALNVTIYNNTAPAGISPTNWAEGGQSFYYGKLPSQYQTWALALRNGWPVQLGDATGLHNDSAMVTTYLCPTYQTKPMRSLLASVFVGTQSMIQPVWNTWILIAALLAKRLWPPKIICHCGGTECISRNSTTAHPADQEKSGGAAQTPGTEKPELLYE